MDTTPAISAVPLMIGVTGHNDLLDSEIPRIRQRVREFFTDLRSLSPELPLRVMSALAEGADRLVAEEALALEIPVVVILPMPREAYLEDFGSAESRESFARLCAQSDVIELPLLPGATPESVRSEPAIRNRHYAQLGVFVCAHCHVLLALWDGKPSDRLGGTAQVVNFHHHDVMPGYTSERRKFRELLADDASDLVYHIFVSRNRPDGEPHASGQAGDTSWYTTDEEQPRSDAMPGRYRQIFSRMAEFNADLGRHRATILRERRDLPMPPAVADLAASLSPINAMFVIADWLAGHYQRNFHRMLWMTHSIAVLMALAYIGYSDVMARPGLILIFLLLFFVGLVLFTLAGRRAWHRKYLDYRTLAEGLRVQYFWVAAGVTARDSTKFAYDNFLQKQDVELGWIRNVMRVTGLRGDVQTRATPEGLLLAMDEWIGDGESGQTAYYGSKARSGVIASSRTEQISTICLALGIVVAIGLGLYHDELSDAAKVPLKVLMAILPLIAATRSAFAQKKAEKELIKQYKFMHRIFRNARRRLTMAQTDEERREILRAVGEAALDEHAEWILMHRERPVELSGM